MPNQDYQWKRFWCPQSSQINLAEDGYLPNPETEWGKIYNRDLVDFDNISNIPCLVLLGEAGMGKTTTAKRAYNQAFERLSNSEDVCLWFELGDYGSKQEIDDEIFHNKTFQAWRKDKHKLHLFLDSLDEGLLSIKILARILRREIEKLPCDRLYFRITCRTADWSYSLEQTLQEKWGKDYVGVYELAPLRREDIIETATQDGINPDDFLQEVSNRNATSLAIKPVTLKFLISTYKNKRFPAFQKDLYEQGCLQLCEEVNLDRRDSGFIGKLSSRQRLIVAGRIAAMLIFANRSAIWTSAEYGDMPHSDIAVENFFIGKESINQQEFLVDEDCIKEVLSVTGLFSSRGSHRIGFAHQTYAEFLAAWYLIQYKTPLKQIMSLIALSKDSKHRVIPQLYQTAAWIASMRTDVFQEVIKTDPDVLLYSDLATTNEAFKVTLVDSLLKLHDEEKLVYQYRTLLYKNLKHSKLHEQLNSYISDTTKSVNARMVAIDIAQICNIKALQESLADVALAPQQPHWVRINAATVVRYIADEKTKARLKPLAIAKIQNETEEELKGYALQAIWPNYITAEELFRSLTQPVAPYIGGTYQDFIAQELGKYLQPSDLLVALEWLKKQKSRHYLNYSFRELSDAILWKAWEHIDQIEIKQEFSKIAYLRLKQPDNIVGNDDLDQKVSFRQQLENSDSKRHQLIESIISLISESDKDPKWLVFYRTGIVLDQDFPWLIECLQTSQTKQTQQIWAKLIWGKFRCNEIKFINAVLLASQTNPILREQFASLIEAVELDSLEARQDKKRYLEAQESNNQNKKTLLDPPPKERILEFLCKIEAGDFGWWPSLCYEMTLKADSIYDGDPFESSLTTLPGWLEADDLTRERILKAAKLYLSQGTPENQAWLGTNQLPCSAIGGYQALRLLLQEAPNLISTLSPEEWQKWTAIIIKYPNWGQTEDEEYRQELVKKAYQNAPIEFIRVLIFLIDKDNQDGNSVDLNHFINNCWDERLAAAFFNKVQDTALIVKNIEILLKELLSHKVDEAKTFAESLISSPLPSSGEIRERAIAAARALILYAEDAGWPTIWPAIQQDPEFGRKIIETVSYIVGYEGNLEQRLKEEDVANLYIFMTKQYPDSEKKKQGSSEDKKLTGIEAYAVTAKDSIKTWRNYIPQRLEERGTPQACEALRKIIRELPELKDRLQWRLLKAEALTRRQTWIPPQPKEVFQMISEKNIVVVKAVEEVKQKPTLIKRLKAAGQAFTFEALQKASDHWLVSPIVKAIEAVIKGE